MKYFVLASLSLIFLSFNRQSAANVSTSINDADTGHVIHVLDGLVTEWPAGRFHLNEDSTVEYAVDNDDRNLYVAMSIPDFAMQMKVMRNGMKFFVDLKGKKKEGKGIEFPIRGEAGNPASSNTSEDMAQKKFDKKTTRNIMSLGLVALKLFGFEKNEHDEQGLIMPGSVNIAFKWDESDVMHIEYTIPFVLLGEPSSIDKKDISLGWTINGFENPRQAESGNTDRNEGGFSRGHGGGGGRGQYGGGGRGFGSHAENNYRKIDPDEMRKEQSFWTKYLIVIQPAQKAF
jgi:uncharacterized membrane protein YgcG